MKHPKLNLLLITFICLTCCNRPSEPGNEEAITPTFLRCENLVNPLGIDVVKPRLSWISESGQRAQKQTAYHILVASSIENLNNGDADLWDSRKISSDASIHVPYEGKELESDKQCYWKVRVWDKNGNPSVWSQPTHWTMGILKQFEWKADWIGKGRGIGEDRPNDIKTRVSSRYVRKDFVLLKKVKYATVSFSGLGLSELYVNGAKISDAVLSPALSEYPESAFYVTYDITENLRKGRNAFGVILGNGRYFAPRLVHDNGNFCATPNYGFPKLILQAKIFFEDGTSTMVKSDVTWKLTGDGPILVNNEFDGEEYDARKEMPGWSKPGFDDSKWMNAELVAPATKRLKAQMMEPIRVTETLKPIAINEIEPGVYVYDIGQNLVGWARLKVRAPAGIRIKMRFAEALKPDGSLYMANIRTAEVTDIYISKGEGLEIYEPRFTYHGYRYLELSGYPGKPDLNTIEGRVVHDDLEVTGKFTTSDSTLNQIYQNAKWGFRGNYRSIPTDCPQRDERQGWLGDRAVGSRGEAFVFDHSTFYAKWLEDIRYAQKTEGSIPDVAPTYWVCYSDNITWPSCYLSITKMLYDQYGDQKVVEEHYPYMKKWMSYMTENYMADYIFDNDTYGDWCMPPDDLNTIHSKDPNKITSGSLLSTSFFYHSANLMKEFAGMLNMQEDASEFDALAKGIYQAYNDKFFDKEHFYYANNTVTSNALSLAFGLVPDEYEGKVFNNIITKTKNEFNSHISTGLVGGLYMMRTLSDRGATDLAYTIATNRDYPSWGYMIEQGATTIWELWNGNTANPAMNSRNHVMLLGDLIIWYYEYLAGIKADKPAFKRLVMKPYMPEGMGHVKASFRSPYGLIKSECEKTNGTFKWNITIPVNTEAIVYVPANSTDEVLESGVNLKKAKGVKLLRTDGAHVVVKVGSGQYNFISQAKQ